jgi:Tol biopolymer transport system component
VVGVAAWAVIARSGDDPSGGGGSSLSPLSRSYMVLTQVNGGPRQLVALDTRGAGNTIDIVDEPDAQRPSISQDRTHIAYLMATEDGQPGIAHVARPDGAEDQTLLTGDAVDTCPLTGRPTWRADSGYLAMVCYDTDGRTSLGIWTVRWDGSGLHRVVSWSSAKSSPSWGGDDRIYFVGNGNGNGSDGDRDQIYSVPSTGGKPRPVTSGEGEASNPDMGEPGLLYQRSPARGRPGDIYLHTKAGTSRLTRTRDVQLPIWSPDTKAVAWLAPSRQDRDQQAVWTASFDISPSGRPSLGKPAQLPMSGTPGAPAWGTR